MKFIKIKIAMQNFILLNSINLYELVVLRIGITYLIMHERCIHFSDVGCLKESKFKTIFELFALKIRQFIKIVNVVQ